MTRAPFLLSALLLLAAFPVTATPLPKPKSRAPAPSKAALATQLVDAARHDNTTRIRQLLAAGASLEGRGPDGQTALFAAAANRNASAVRLLLQKGASVDAKDRDGRTPLLAAAGGLAEVVRPLVEARANLEARDREGFTPLLLAVAGKNQESAELLLERGANANAVSYGGATAFSLNDPNSKIGAFFGPELTDLLLAYGGDPKRPEWGHTPLLVAAGRGELAKVRQLLSAGADPNERGEADRPVLTCALERGHLDVAEQLLKSGAKPDLPDVQGNTALMQMAAGGKIAAMELLLRSGAIADHADSDGWTAFHVAAAQGQVEAMKVLLAHGADLNRRTAQKQTPVVIAALLAREVALDFLTAQPAVQHSATMDEALARRDLTALRGLLDHGANANGRTSEGVPYLSLAVRTRQVEAVRVLLEKGADPNRSDALGETPLVNACWARPYPARQAGDPIPTPEQEARWDHTEAQAQAPIARMLLDKGARTEARDKTFGHTPLIEAALNGDPNLVRMLLEHHADLGPKDIGGITALRGAGASGSEEVMALLLRAGEQPPKMALDEAVDTEDVAAARKALDDGAKPDAILGPKHTALFSLRGGQPDVDGHDYKDQRIPVLFRAAVLNHTTMLKTLLARGADLNAKDADGRTALMAAVGSASSDCLKTLLEARADPNVADRFGVTPLMLAAAEGDLEKVTLLLAHGADARRVDDGDRSAIHYYAAHAGIFGEGVLKIAAALKSAGGDLDQPAKDGLAPLAEAFIAEGPGAAFQGILEAGAKAELRLPNGKTLLMHAAGSGKGWMVRALLDHGANAKATDFQDHTPLMAAATEDNARVVRYLLEHGADPNVRAKDGLTVLSIATRSGAKRVAAALRKAGARE